MALVDAPLIITLLSLGLFGGLLSGMVGIGGGIIMFPLLLYVPASLGVALLSVKAAASITSVQSFFGAISGAIAHHRHRRVYWPLARDFGGAMALTSLASSIASVYVPSHWILVLFALMASLAAILMLFPRPEVEAQALDEQVHYQRPRAIVLGGAIGIGSGLVGQGGGFLFVPVMMYFLAAPLRIAIGTALMVGVVSSAAVVLGRIGTAQIPWAMTAITVLGAVVGAQIGCELSQRAPRRLLRGILAAVVLLTAGKMIYDLLL